MPMKIGEAFPGFEGATDWINGTREEAEVPPDGSPILVHFWSISCGICKENFPGLRKLLATYGSAGLKPFAVHLPRYEADTDLDAVRAAAGANMITEICAVDNLHKLKDAFKNEQGWVPVYYLFDAEGNLKTRAAGEFGIGILGSALERMFAGRMNEASA
ncbi:MAG: redoxin domain-containing protein [Acidobacteriota bacterium]|nr:MAG: redoxin domain-containing protein [Acidobacteriota bacterium]